MPETLYHLPLEFAGLIIIGVLCFYSVAGIAVTRRFILPHLKVSEDDSEFTGAMIQAIMVFYGLAVALVAVSVWETHSEVSDTVSQEASRLASLYRDVSGYPEPLRSELRADLLGYTNYLIDDAWPQQRAGIHPTGGIKWMNQFQVRLFSFEPVTESSKILHGEVMRAYNHMLEVRRLRLDAMLIRLPGTLWFVILIGAAIFLAATFLFKLRDVRLHIIQVTLLSVFIGLVLTLIVAFDRPFHGELGIDPEPYRLIRDQLMAP